MSPLSKDVQHRVRTLISLQNCAYVLRYELEDHYEWHDDMDYRQRVMGLDGRNKSQGDKQSNREFMRDMRTDNGADIELKNQRASMTGPRASPRV